MTWRKSFRDAAKAAISGAGFSTGWTELPSWAQSIDAGALPAWSVATPDERSSAMDKDSVERAVQLTVTVTRAGGDDLDDLLDADADAVEAVVSPALAAAGIAAELTTTRTRYSGEATSRLGRIELSYDCRAETALT